MPHFSANLNWLYSEVPFPNRAAQAAADGFSAVECLFPYQELSASEFHVQLTDQALDLVLFNTPPGNWAKGERGLAIHEEKQAEFRQSFLEVALPYALVTHCPRLHVMAGVMGPDDSSQRLQDTFLENLAWACRQAAVHHLGLVIEPINPMDMPNYFLTHQAQAHALVQTLDAANLGVQMDLYHCHRVEGQVTQEVLHWVPSGRVHHMQIAGFPGRHEPIGGDIDYPSLFALLDTLGYEGHVGCEYQPTTTTRAGLLQWWPDQRKILHGARKNQTTI